jgi:WD40 repeat protein
MKGYSISFFLCLFLIQNFTCLAFSRRNNYFATISGSSSICYNADPAAPPYTYVVSGSATTGYNWILPSGVEYISGQGTNMLTVKFRSPGLGKVIAVTGNGTSASYTVNVYDMITRGTITGTTTVCKGQINVDYSIYLPTATQYTWGIPSGSGITIVSGGGSSTVKLSFSSTFTTATIQAAGVQGTCGLSPYASFTITANNSLPSAPGTIGGLL